MTPNCWKVYNFLLVFFFSLSLVKHFLFKMTSTNLFGDVLSAGSPLTIISSSLPASGHEGDPCLRSSDCAEGYCCARHFWTKICKPVLRQGEVCTKQRKKGSHGLEIFQRCDCAKGLSCKVWKDATSSSKSRLHMCQKIWSGGSCCLHFFFKGWVVATLKGVTDRDRTDCVGSGSLFGELRAIGIASMCLLQEVPPCTHIQTCTLKHEHTHCVLDACAVLAHIFNKPSVRAVIDACKNGGNRGYMVIHEIQTLNKQTDRILTEKPYFFLRSTIFT